MPKVLFLTAYPIEDASCRYRIHQFLPWLERSGYQCTVRPFATGQLFQALRQRGCITTKVLQTLFCSARRLVKLRDLSDFEFVVIHREAFPFFAPAVENWILQRAQTLRRQRQERGVPPPKVIFSFDDAIYAGHDDVSQLNHPRLYRWKHGRGYDGVIRGSAHVIAGNRILADYARRLNPRVSVIPTVVDCDLYQLKPPEQRDRVTIGWMGSRSTVQYLTLIEPALRRLARIHAGKVQFRFVGHPDYKLDVPGFETLPFCLDRELDDLHSFDIGLMPLPDTEWTRGKCAFKAIQYMACGAAVVASPVGITSDLIQHKRNGFLATSPAQWYVALEGLVRDAALRAKVAWAARRTVEKSYSLSVWGPRFVALFDQLSRRPGISEQKDVAA
ncbi:MAG TPA: glycosyltransferase family 4 protein [Terriglobales bacterium]|nr:glycosyltransferase family 4 protein [Terriglobales bacterium]